MRILERRYLLRDTQGQIIEDPAGMFLRVASHIATAERLFPSGDEHYWRPKFYELMSGLEFLPNSPTLMNAGRLRGQLAACFVLPIEDTLESIFETLKNAALIHKSGGGTGFSFSRLRPAGAKVKSTMGAASGPVSFMIVYDAATEVVKQGSSRRGANMAVLRVDHPDIEEFITVKRSRGRLNNFNLSVGITDAFMQAVEAGGEFSLIHPGTGQIVRSVAARWLFELIVTTAWENGEPGVLFLDRVNAANPTPVLGEIESSNPCGEQPLLPYESCNLGSINLVKMLHKSAEGWQIDYTKFKDVIQTAIRFLDNAIDVNVFPLEETRMITLGNRKIGLGVMGFADLLIYLGIPYNTEAAVCKAEEIMGFIAAESVRTSEQLAKERGAFPNFAQSIYAAAGKLPLRNATTTTIAPTGTISIIAGCSSGIEPLFAIAFTRNVMEHELLKDINPVFLELATEYNFADQRILAEVGKRGIVANVEGIPAKIRSTFITAHEIAPEWHIRIQAAFQKFTHNAVSKTINYPHDAAIEDVGQGFRLAYQYGCKGLTVYRDGSRAEQVLTRGLRNTHCELTTGDICD
jgi:ribonucleoside-diphosphate reductase alpha chain